MSSLKQNVLQPKKRQDVRQKLKLQLLQQPRKKLHSRNRKIRQYMMKTVTKLMLQKQQKTEILYMTKMETRLIRARLQQKQLQKTVEVVM